MKIFRLHCLVGLIFVLAHPLSSLAGGPAPTGENAYCEKGDVPKFGNKDGPAELPRSCYYTGVDGTPSPGKLIHVRAGSDLYSAAEAAKCGDVLSLPAGASFDVKAFPSKNCDNSHYVTVRTDAPDSKLPPEGTRISPAWTGVTSLPGRPAYIQPPGGPAKLMTTFVVKEPTGARVGDHYRFLGIEWTSQPTAHVARLVTTEGANHVVFDRSWFHPAEGAEMAKGIMMIHGTRSIAVINSYLSGFNCVASVGACTDASAIGGGNGVEGDDNGTFKIYNNFLEAAGECVLFGGSVSDVNPTDIEVRRNHLFRPMIWKEGEAGYSPSALGRPYIVKNNFELKSAIRVLFEANLLENTWGGFSQTGSAILLTPKNQMARCPKCVVLDVTIRYNRVRNVAGIIQIINGQDKNGAPSADGGRYSIHDLRADSIHESDWKGQGAFALVVSDVPLLHDVTFDHVTAFVPGPLFQIKGKNEKKIPNFVVINSLFMGGNKTPELAPAGRPADCPGPMIQREGAKGVLKECFVDFKFEKNLIITHNRGWPSGNLTVSSPESAGIRDLRQGGTPDLRLCRKGVPGCKETSPGLAAASDGKDIGADEDAIDTALAGVE
jgi:hypothetical protein